MLLLLNQTKQGRGGDWRGRKENSSPTLAPIPFTSYSSSSPQRRPSPGPSCRQCATTRRLAAPWAACLLCVSWYGAFLDPHLCSCFCCCSIANWFGRVLFLSCGMEILCLFVDSLWSSVQALLYCFSVISSSFRNLDCFNCSRFLNSWCAVQYITNTTNFKKSKQPTC